MESEKLLSVDLNTELETMAQTCTSLQETNSELRLTVQSREDKVKDLEDELLFKENRLKEMESALAKYKLEAESLSGIRETCRELEEKMATHESLKAQLEEQAKVSQCVSMAGTVMLADAAPVCTPSRTMRHHCSDPHRNCTPWSWIRLRRTWS